MLEFLVQGFLLGFAYLAPIGMQNMYVINSAMGMGRLDEKNLRAIIYYAAQSSPPMA